MSRILYIFICLSMLASCNQGTDDDVSIELDCPSLEVLKSDKFKDLDIQTCEIKDYKLTGNSLKLSLSYTGCSVPRVFRLVVDEAKSKSYPPQQNAKLAYEQQSCQATFSFEVCFDVSELERPTVLKFPQTASGIQSIAIN
jgi:hypothetical protein